VSTFPPFVKALFTLAKCPTAAAATAIGTLALGPCALQQQIGPVLFVVTLLKEPRQVQLLFATVARVFVINVIITASKCNDLTIYHINVTFKAARVILQLLAPFHPQ
jgi:hypothetical protein